MSDQGVPRSTCPYEVGLAAKEQQQAVTARGVATRKPRAANSFLGVIAEFYLKINMSRGGDCCFFAKMLIFWGGEYRYVWYTPVLQ
jgi:hypothetical protein